MEVDGQPSSDTPPPHPSHPPCEEVARAPELQALDVGAVAPQHGGGAGRRRRGSVRWRPPAPARAHAGTGIVCSARPLSAAVLVG